jgi:hypothetical protein
MINFISLRLLEVFLLLNNLNNSLLPLHFRVLSNHNSRITSLTPIPPTLHNI